MTDVSFADHTEIKYTFMNVRSEINQPKVVSRKKMYMFNSGVLKYNFGKYKL